MLGGGGALILFPGGGKMEVRAPAGRLCSSTRAELVTVRTALVAVRELDGLLAEPPVVVCLDSQAALLSLESGPAAQTTTMGAAVWELLLALAERGQRPHLQWVPAHCGLEGNECADSIAKDATTMDQTDASIDIRSATRAAVRFARYEWQRAWPDGWFRDIFGRHLPGPISGDDRESAVDVHQLRAGHWSGSEQWLHRVGRRPTDGCPGCRDAECPAAQCRVCGEEADTPRHILLRCPCLCGARLFSMGNIHGRPRDLRRDDVVAALAAGYRSFQSRSATSRP